MVKLKRGELGAVTIIMLLLLAVVVLALTPFVSLVTQIIKGQGNIAEEPITLAQSTRSLKGGSVLKLQLYR